MRSILILLAAVCVTGAASASEEAVPAAAETVSHTVSVSRTMTALTVQDRSETPFSRPVVRFIVLPEGVLQAEVTLRGANGAAAGVQVTAGKPMTMRGLRLLPVTISRETAEPAGKAAAVPSIVEIDIRHEEGREAGSEPSRPLRHARGFFDLLGTALVDGQGRIAQATESGSYLIISAPEFVTAVEPLAGWKREMGFEVSLVTTDETGGSNQEILDYISERYDNDANPPAYLLLVGDVEQIPSFDFHSNVTDHPYAMLDGDDFLPDLHVGRLSVSNTSEAQTIVAKILRHERNPYVDAGTDWFARGLVVGANYGSSTPVPVSRWCRNQLLDIGFAEVDSVYFPPHYGQSGTILIRSAIDRGVSIVTYRGWAYGTEGWEPPHFTVWDIPTLSNGWMLPVVFSFVCLNNDFANEEPVFGEVWIRAGSAEDPRGAVAFIGNGEHWSHTRLNDAAAIGAFKAIGDRGVRRLGEILDASKMEILTQFPDRIDYETATDTSVEFYFYIYNLLGDPAMDLWIGPPKAVQIEHAATVAAGSNFIEVTVRESSTQSPVEGARVGVTQGGVLLGSTWTDANGLAHVPARFDETTDPVLVTVTGANISPYQGTVTVETAEVFLALSTTVTDDDQTGASDGNGDGVINPGETIELSITLANRGSATADGVEGTIDAGGVSWLEIVDGTVGFPQIPVGGRATSTEPLVLQIDPEAEDGATAQLRLEVSSGATVSSSDLTLSVSGPALRHLSTTIDGDGVLTPGEIAQLTITLRNDGSIAASPSTATLRAAVADLVSIPDSLSSFGGIEVGASGTSESAFQIEVGPDVATGQAIPLILSCTTAEGYISETTLSIVVGPTAYYAPLGPDGYGYYAYDNTDTDYPDAAPLYDWIHCSTLYGGTGQKLDLGNNEIVTVDLPFSFTYYGRSYDQIAVSDNGWISFDLSSYFDFYNWHMPNSYGNASQVAPFWDNLDPEKTTAEEVLVGDGVYSYYDTDRDLFVVEWSRLANHIPELDDKQSFEVILFDPERYPTPTGDGILQFQYRRIVNNDESRMYATVGIEDETEQIGLQYTYSNLFPQAAAPLSAGLAIRFTTQPARFVPFDLAKFQARSTGDGIVLTWEPIDDRPRGETRIYRGDPGASGMPVEVAALDPEARAFIDTEADPGAEYDYQIGSLDPVGRETILGPFPYRGQVRGSLAVALEARAPNPFRGDLELAYSIPARSAVLLRIYDLSGRLVRTLVDGPIDAGVWNIRWDGRDDRGRDLPSGIYLCKLRAGQERRTLKTTLLR